MLIQPYGVIFVNQSVLLTLVLQFYIISGNSNGNGDDNGEIPPPEEEHDGDGEDELF